MRETGRNGVKAKLKKRLKKEFPQCKIFSLDPNEVQGVPDLVVLCNNTWATLEVKNSSKAGKQPNQEFYVEEHNNMSFSRIIFPENEDEVINDLSIHLKNFEKGGR